MNKHRKRKLQDVYASIPKIKCKGLCTDYCGAIGYEKGELEEMKKASGKMPAVDQDLNCNYLEMGRCSIYENRPMICRIWGVVEQMECPNGCEIERKIAPLELVKLFAAVKKIAGDGTTYKSAPPDLWNKDLIQKKELWNKDAVRKLLEI